MMNPVFFANANSDGREKWTFTGEGCRIRLIFKFGDERVSNPVRVDAMGFIQSFCS